jgi:prepilin-type N-terminal cleavage/methylation domain-containing protein
MIGGLQREKSGFTIVEILLVIVVLSILAGLTMVAYRGVQDRARVAATRSEMLSVGQSAAIFRAENDRSPSTMGDFSTVLKEAKIYDSTRTAEKSYAICADTFGYAFVAWNPLVQTYKNGDTLYLYSSNGGQQIFELPNSSLSSANQLDKICDQVYDASVFDAWTYDIP